jgi:UDPglucose--hexose-1-phosphate uridylyltransferase
MTGVAGFEWGTGVFINPVPPEEAAEHLRSALNGHRAPEIEVPPT